MNEGIKWYVMQDWTGRELNRFESLDEWEEYRNEIIESDEDYKEAKTDEEREAIEEGISEDLYGYGLDEEGNQIAIQWG